MPPLPIDSRRRQTAAKLAALMLANAFIFQEQLAGLREEVQNVNAMLARRNFIGDTAAHWNMIIREIDYVPIFSVARDILLSLPGDSDTDAAIRNLAAQALQIVTRKAALRHDLMGRIYHLLLHEAKYLGTYYTSVPAATLLLKLCLDHERWPDMDWSDGEKLKQFQIADIACGTGTLLMAASQALTDNFIKFKMSKGEPVNEGALRDLHKLVVEEVLSGYDVLPSAVHLTASTLALLAPETCFEKMRLYSLTLGKLQATEAGRVYLGSIDYVSASSVRTQLDLMTPLFGAARRVADDDVESVAELPKLDLCVMNPPFVRSVGGNLLFGSVSEFRKEMQAELAKRIKRTKLSASSTAGLGSVFAAIGDRHVKQNGRLALVLPAAVTTGISWQKTRRFLAQRYVLETVIVSHDPARWNFSENTSLSEALVIARKRAPKETNQISGELPTQFINLWKNPSASAHALAVGDRITSEAAAPVGTPAKPRHGVCSLMVGNTKYGEMIELPWGELRLGPWLGGCFAQTELVRAAWFLRQGYVYIPGRNRMEAVPVQPLKRIATLGPDTRDIHDGFTKSNARTSYPALWGHKATAYKAMAAPVNAWLSPRTVPAPKRKFIRDVGLLWPRAGNVMISERLRLNTQSIVAVCLPRAGLSNVWWPVSLRDLDDERAPKVLTLWLNSTLGLLAFLAYRTPTEGAWVKFKKPMIEALPVLAPSKLTDKQLTDLAAAYDEMANDELAVFQKMDHDPVRTLIDDALSKILELPKLAPIRGLLAKEPAVCGRPIDREPDRGIEAAASLQFSLL